MKTRSPISGKNSIWALYCAFTNNFVQCGTSETFFYETLVQPKWLKFQVRLFKNSFCHHVKAHRKTVYDGYRESLNLCGVMYA